MDHDTRGFGFSSVKNSDNSCTKELESLKELYHALYKSNPQPMFIYDSKSLKFLDANDAALQFYGYSADEIGKLTIADIRPSDEIVKLIKHLSSETHVMNAGVWRHKKRNGEIVHVNVVSQDIIYQNVNARHVMISDMSGEQKFRDLFHSHSAVKLIIDAETGDINDANESAISFYGWPREKLLAMNIREINTLPYEKIAEAMLIVKEKLKQSFQFKHRKANGDIVDVEVYSSKINIGGKDFLHSIVQDITEQKRAEQKVKLLSKSIEQSPIGILLTDADGKVEFCNQKFTDLTEYTFEEVSGTYSQLMDTTKGNLLPTSVWKTIRMGKTWKGEFHDKKKHGDMYWANITISPLTSSDGKILNYIMLYEDISNQKRMMSDLVEAKLKAEESDRLKTSFLANMSHEIRTPMNGILGFMDILRQPGLTGDEMEEYINMVNISGQRLMNTINDIIDIAKIESGTSLVTKSSFDFNQLMTDRYNFFKPEALKKNLTIEITSLLPTNKSTVICDRYKVESILANLIKNAIKFTFSGSISLQSSIEDNKLIFSVTDTGKGISADKIDDIFNRFVQADSSLSRDYEGSGLGLAICRSYAELLGGSIDVRSKPYSGSIFTVTLPYIEPSQDENERAVTDLNLLSDKLSVLIAEDDEISFLYLKTAIRKQKINLIRAINGQEAVNLVEELGNAINIVFMDIKMPVMDGYQALTLIKKKFPLIPIIAMTAYSSNEDMKRIKQAGFSDYISKPMRADEILDLLKKWIKY